MMQLEKNWLIADCKKDNDPSHRQDYAVFLRFESVGSKDGFLRDDNKNIKKCDMFLHSTSSWSL